MSVIDDRIYNFDYYIKKLPLYLKNSNTFIEHFRIWYDILISIVENSNKILDLINIFDSDYLEKINALDESEEKNKSDILDKLGSIFNVKRNFSVVYTESGVVTKKQLSLNNEDFLLLIRSQIIKNYSDGSYQQMREFYDKAKLNIYLKSNSSADVNIYLLTISGEETYSESIKDMFKAELLTIKSMGITYHHAILTVENILVWSNEDETIGNRKWAGEEPDEDNDGVWIL